jgi:zinc/manganese transport system substrate-binding protein
MRTFATRAGRVVLAGLLTVTLAACGSGGTGAATAGSSGAAADSAPIPVVTSTNVWGDVVAQIGGDQVQVTPLIVDPAADPHSFEPNARAQLAVSKAALLVANGGGYDSYMDTMVQASGTTVPLIDAVEVSGLETDTAAAGAAESGAQESHSAGEETHAEGEAAHEGEEEHGHGEFNEHVWYDFPTVDAVATRIADELTTIRPERADFFQANLTAFTDRLAGLTTKLEEIDATHGGTPVAITEPVPLYLTEAAGLVNKTPDEFSEAIEEGTDVPPTVLADTLALFSGKAVDVLVYNEQTSSPETEQVLAAAQDNSIAVVAVTETLPEGKDYLSWMDANVTALATALGG